MKTLFFMKSIKWLRELPVHSKFNIIIALIMLILVFGLINFWVSLKIMSAVRAYVGGEGLWSKAQKDAVNNLIRYTDTYDETDYERYLQFLQVPLGDKQARLELDKDDFDYEVVRLGFIQGGNAPEDVENLVFLYRWFKNISYMEIAIDDWTKGDAEIEKLMGIGEAIHSVISEGGNKPGRTAEVAQLVEEVYTTDRRLTVLENHFSATLGEGSRWIRNTLFLLTAILTVLLGSMALFVAYYIGKIVEEVDRFKTEFVSMASHELRTPMAAIKGYVSMILGGRYGLLTPKLRKPLENISISIERLIGLSNDLLDAARIESRGLKPKIVESRTDDLIREVARNLEDMALHKGVKIKVGDLDESIVFVDQGFVRQILNNLVGNAIKFTEKGVVEIFSGALGKRQNIYVRDTGVGIAPGDRAKIFLRFQQLTSRTGHRPVGSGLGLYISRELALKMKGDLSLENSEPDMGSTFILSLPIKG